MTIFHIMLIIVFYNIMPRIYMSVREYKFAAYNKYADCITFSLPVTSTHTQMSYFFISSRLLSFIFMLVVSAPVSFYSLPLLSRMLHCQTVFIVL